MDIPLSSDALDLALHPGPSSNLLAVGLISGKVQLFDYSSFVSSQQNGDALDAVQPKKRRKKARGSDDSEIEDLSSGKGKAKAGSAASSEDAAYTKLWTSRLKPKSCRGVSFAPDGSRMWCLSKNGTLYSLDTERGKVVDSYPDAHEAAPSRVLPLATAGGSNHHQSLVVTGDDDGVVRLWDSRLKSNGEGAKSNPVKSYDHHFDWITDFHYSSHLVPPRMSKEDKEKKEAADKAKADKKRKKAAALRAARGDESDSASDDESIPVSARPGRERLICTSGDGTLSAIDFRGGSGKNKGVEVSDDQEDELLSLTSVRNDTKLIVGTQLGLLSLWSPSRGLLDHIDRIPGHPASIDSLLPLDDSTVLTGSSDGLIRVVQVLPHKFLGVVADHGMGLPVERMARKEGVLVSCGHGKEVKVTDLQDLLDGNSDEDSGDSDDESNDTDDDAEALARKMGDGDSSEEEEDDDNDEEAETGAEVGQVHPSKAPISDDDDDNDSDDEEEASSEDGQSPSPPPPTRQMKSTKKSLKEAAQKHATARGGGGGGGQDFFADL